ncbi:MAG: presqualene diphosphate synthase HpnD [Burkholderiaceae bacterium]|jgi:phytoene synthase
MTPDQYCQEKAAQSGSSFYYSFLFLPPARRRAITALYAFCREVDDVVDECTDTGVAAQTLAWWRDELARLDHHTPTHPVTQALEPHMVPFGITIERLNLIIDGMQMDLQQTRYLDYAGLESYCFHVAGVVGLLAAGIFGHSDPKTLDYAKELGIAFQLTNIIRDVGEDARIGRVYLPMDELQRFGVTASDLTHARYTPGFTELMRFQAQRARATYASAYALLPPADRNAQRPGLIMAAIYSTLLDEIERENFQVLHQRISLTPVRKLWIAWRTWVGTRHRRG